MNGLVVTTADLAGFAVVLARTAALVATAPVLGDRTTPRIVQAVVALTLAGAGAAVAGPVSPDDVVALVPLELAFGLVAGLSARLLVAGAELGGQVIGLQMGVGIAGQLDPANGEESLPTRRIVAVLAGLAFVALGGLDATLRVVASPRPSAAGVWMLAAELPFRAADALALGARIAAPLLLAGTAATIALALASRSAPSVNVFSVELALRVAVALAVLVACAPALIAEVAHAAGLAADLLRSLSA